MNNCQACLGFLWCLLSIPCYTDTYLPFIVPAIVDSIFFIPSIVLVCVLSPPLTITSCAELTTDTTNFLLPIDKGKSVSYLTFVGSGRTICYELQAVRGLAIALSVFFFFSGVSTLFLFNRRRRQTSRRAEAKEAAGTYPDNSRAAWQSANRVSGEACDPADDAWQMSDDQDEESWKSPEWEHERQYIHTQTQIDLQRLLHLPPRGRGPATRSQPRRSAVRRPNRGAGIEKPYWSSEHVAIIPQAPTRHPSRTPTPPQSRKQQTKPSYSRRPSQPIPTRQATASSTARKSQRATEILPTPSDQVPVTSPAFDGGKSDGEIPIGYSMLSSGGCCPHRNRAHQTPEGAASAERRRPHRGERRT